MTVQLQVAKARSVSKHSGVYIVSKPATLREYAKTYGIKADHMAKALTRAKKELCAR